MDRITIIGLGSVGASLGLAIKQWIVAPEATGGSRRDIEVVGFDFDTDRQKAAERIGAIDKAEWRLPRAVEGAALVVLAMDAREVESTMQELAPLLDPDTILTDTSTNKQATLQAATRLLPKGVSYIAGHPILPTSEESPSAGLFEGCIYGLFPHDASEEGSLEVVIGLVQAIGAKPYFADPAEFDAQVIASTYLPIMASAALMNTASRGPGWRDREWVTNSNLAEYTRLASGNPRFLSDTLGQQPEEVVRWLDRYIASLGELRDLVARQDTEGQEQLRQYLQDASVGRMEWLEPRRERPEWLQKDTARDQMNRIFLGRLGARRKRT